MNKFKLRHLILEELYNLPNNPVDKTYPNSIFDHQLKERLPNKLDENEYSRALKYLNGEKEIILNRYNDGTNKIIPETQATQSYLDEKYLLKNTEYRRNSIQHYLKITAWIFGITLGSASFILNLFKTYKDIKSLPVIEHRVNNIEKNLNNCNTIHQKVSKKKN